MNTTKRRLPNLVLAAAILAVVAVLVFRGRQEPCRERDAGQPASRMSDEAPASRAGERSQEPAGDYMGPRPRMLSAQFSPHLQNLLGSSSALTSRERVTWLRDYGHTFTETDVQAVLAYLHGGRRPPGLSTGAWHWIVDELFTALRNGTKDPGVLTGQIHEIFSNRSLDPVVRDYALQHLGHLGKEGGDRELIRTAAQAGLQEVDSTIAGTALLVMHGEEREQGQQSGASQGDGPGAPAPDIDSGRLALEVLRNDRAGVASKVTAFQLAARHDAEGLRAIAKEVLSSDENVLLQIAAIAAIAELGTPADLELLVSLSPKSQPLRNVTRSALNKIRNAQ